MSPKQKKQSVVIDLKKTLPLLKRSDVSFVGVFGSYARGDQSPNSDIDLLVRFAKPKGLLGLIRLERLLSEKLQRKVDLVTERELSPYIRDNVLNDLQVIYGEI